MHRRNTLQDWNPKQREIKGICFIQQGMRDGNVNRKYGRCIWGFFFGQNLSWEIVRSEKGLWINFSEKQDQ